MTTTASLTAINRMSIVAGREVSHDTITVSRDGEEIDTITVESSEDSAPYDAALAAAGYTDVVWAR